MKATQQRGNLHDITKEKNFKKNYNCYSEPSFKGVPLMRATDENVLTYTQIDGPNEITVKKDDNFGDHKFWDTIDFDEP